MADSISLSALRKTKLSSEIATKEWTEENFLSGGNTFWYGECSTAAGTAAKTVTIENFPPLSDLKNGDSVRIKFANAQTYNGAPTLNINETGAKYIKSNGFTNAARYEWVAGEIIDFSWNVSAWTIVDGGKATTSYYGVTKLASTATTTSDSYAATPGAIFKVVGNTVYGIPNTWTKNTQYSVGDKVYNAGKYYECIEAHSSATFDATKFREIDNAQTQIDNLCVAIEDIDVPTKVSELQNDVPYLSAHQSLSALNNYIPLSGNAKIASAFVLSSNGTDGYKQTINLWGGDGDGEGDTAIGYNAIVENSHGMASGGGVAVGSNAKAKSTSAGNSIAIGSNAIASNIDSIQLGWGTNNTANTLQIWDKPLLERTSGKIFIDRIPTGTTSSTVALGNHTHAYLPLSGGTLTGNLIVDQGSSIKVINTDKSMEPAVEIKSDGTIVKSSTLFSYALTLPSAAGTLALTSDILSNTNQLTNGAGFITSSQVDTKIAALDGTITGSAGTGKTLTAFSQTDGKVTAGFGDISITKSQISDFPTIPTVNNGTLTIQRNGSTVQTFTANQSTAVSANIIVPTKTSDLTNDSGYVVSSDLTKVMEYQGSVETYENLPVNAEKGDVYNVISAHGDYPPGTNYAWSGTTWDPLGGSIDTSVFVLKDKVDTQTTAYINITGNHLTSQTLYIDAAPALTAAINSIETKLSGVTVDGITVPISNGVANVSLSNYALSSDLYNLSVEVIDSLSNVVNPKLSTIADLVSAETEKVDSISARLDDFALTSDIPTDLSDLTNNAGYALISDIPQVEGKYLHLSGDTVSANFALKIGTTNALSGLNGNLAIGQNSQATGIASTALGYNTKALSDNSTAVGYTAQATGLHSTAVGWYAQATKDNSIAIGYNAQATNTYSIAIGTGAKATGYFSVGLGTAAQATGSQSTAIGRGTQATHNSTALGDDSKATGQGSTALGNNAKTTGQRAIAIGYGTAATATNAIQIGTVGGNALSNNTADTLQIWDKPLLKRTNGKIFIERIPTGTTSATVALGNHTHGEYALTSSIPLSTSQLLNDSGFVVSSDLTKVFAEISALNKLSSEVTYGLSDVVNPKLSTIANSVEEEVVKLDELSGKLSGYSLKDHTHNVSSITNLQTTLDAKVSAITLNGVKKTSTNGNINLGTVLSAHQSLSALSTYIPLSGGCVSDSFYLSSGLNGGDYFLTNAGLTLGLGATATGSGANAYGWNATAAGHESLAVGFGAKVQNAYNVDCVAIGYGAVVNTGTTFADGAKAIQLGNGTNTISGSTQIFNWTLLNSNGDIPEARLSAHGFRTILPIVSNNNLTVTLSSDVKTYRITDSSGNGTFPTLSAPTNISDFGDCYYAFEIEWKTNSAAASFPQQHDWINYPEMQSDGQQHTYYITGRYDSTNTEYTMNCWRVK